MSIDELFNVIVKAKEDFEIEGITLSGGEPSLQKGLTELCRRVHQIGLGIILFSGKYQEFLPLELIKEVDLLLAGPYEKDKPDSRNLLGSANKKIVLISDRYADALDYFTNGNLKEEVAVDGSQLFFNGD